MGSGPLATPPASKEPTSHITIQGALHTNDRHCRSTIDKSTISRDARSTGLRLVDNQNGQRALRCGKQVRAECSWGDGEYRRIKQPWMTRESPTDTRKWSLKNWLRSNDARKIGYNSLRLMCALAMPWRCVAELMNRWSNGARLEYWLFSSLIILKYF